MAKLYPTRDTDTRSRNRDARHHLTPPGITHLIPTTPRDAVWWNGCAPQGWSWLMTEIRRRLGDGVQFWKCWETQERGLLHLHAILWAPGVTEAHMRAVWQSALSHVYSLSGGVWGWGPQQRLDRIGAKCTVAQLMTEYGFDAEEASERWDEEESRARSVMRRCTEPNTALSPASGPCR